MRAHATSRQSRVAVCPADAAHSAPASVPARGGLSALDGRIKSAIEIAVREFQKPPSVRELAARLGLSPSRFEHLFKQETGQGFRAFIHEMRMTRAKKLLHDPTLSIKEVASAVGYTHHSDFAHDFKKRYGRPPSRTR